MYKLKEYTEIPPVFVESQRTEKLELLGIILWHWLRKQENWVVLQSGRPNLSANTSTEEKLQSHSDFLPSETWGNKEKTQSPFKNTAMGITLK